MFKNNNGRFVGRLGKDAHFTAKAAYLALCATHFGRNRETDERIEENTWVNIQVIGERNLNYLRERAVKGATVDITFILRNEFTEVDGKRMQSVVLQCNPYRGCEVTVYAKAPSTSDRTGHPAEQSDQDQYADAMDQDTPF